MPDVAEDVDDIASELKGMPAGAQASPGFAAQLSYCTTLDLVLERFRRA